MTARSASLSPVSPPRAIAWELGRRHRWGFAALAAFLAILGLVKLVAWQRGWIVSFENPQSFALAVAIPMSSSVLYCLAVFTYGLSGDLGARESTYPRRMFSLPISSAALAGWPMLYGAVAMMLLWVVLRVFLIWPSHFDIPVIWPALLAAAIIAWSQALTWMPYGLRNARVAAMVFWLVNIDTVVLLALHFRAHEAAMVAFLAPQVPLAYVVARYAVTRARRGDTPDWSGVFRRARTMRSSERRPAFASPMRAQLWLEWRRHGRTLPAWVALLLPFELLLLVAAGSATDVVGAILLAVMATPPVMASFVAATMDRAASGAGDAYGMLPFAATRPMTSVDLIRAKLTVAVWSTLVTWLLVLIAAPVALLVTGTWELVVNEAHSAVRVMGAARVSVLWGLNLLLFMAATWQQLVQTMYIGLTGRAWLAKAYVFGMLLLLSVAGPVLDRIITDGGLKGALWDAVPGILAVLVAGKIAASIWVAIRLHGSGLLRERTLIYGAACWCVAVLGLHAVLLWFVATTIFPSYLLALFAILAVPFARISAAPLALAWNRHR